MSNLHKLDRWYEGLDPMDPQPYGDVTTYHLAADWLEGLEVEDWGCGKGYFRTLIHEGLYRGLDGSETPFADDVVDLCSYVSDVQGVMLRHVLEHNDRWQLVLKNALDSATWRLVIILFTPMAEQTHEITRTEELDVPDLSFSHDELMLYFNDFEVRWEDLTTNTQYGTERIYYLERT